MIKNRLFYLILLIIVIFLNCIYIEFEFMLLLILMVAVPVVFYILFIVCLKNQKVYIDNTRKDVKKGGKASVCVKVYSGFNVGESMGTLQVGYSFLNSKPGDKSDNGYMCVEMSAFKRCLSATECSMHTIHAGLIKFNVEKLTVYDYTGLFSKTYRFYGEKKVYVFPELIGEEYQVGTHEDGYSECVKTYIEDDTSEVLDLREYQPGDEEKKIHWKLSAHSGSILVREYGEENDRKNTIAIDLSVYEHKDFMSILDRIYQTALSVANGCLINGENARFVVFNPRVSKAEFYEFYNSESLKDAVKNLMNIKCRGNTIDILNKDIQKNRKLFIDPVILVTSRDYDSLDYLVINVCKKGYKEEVKEIIKEMKK